MGGKKTFVLRVSQEMYDSLERWAADEFRSVNGQIEYMLYQSLKTAGRLKPDNNGKTDREKELEY